MVNKLTVEEIGTKELNAEEIISKAKDSVSRFNFAVVMREKAYNSIGPLMGTAEPEVAEAWDSFNEALNHLISTEALCFGISEK